MGKFLLALDQGTTSSRALLFDAQGAVVGVAQREFAQLFPHAGWVEHDPWAIWGSQREAAREVLARCGVSAAQVAGLGIANQRETTLVWDRASGEPVGNAIVWQDRRTTAMCQRVLAEGAEPEVRARTGLVIDPYFSASKIAWLLGEVPGVRERAERGELAFGTVDSWLVWQLTGGLRHVTDRTNAARTMLYSVVEDRWDEEMLRLWGVPGAMLPEVVWSSERVGAVRGVEGLDGIEIAGIAGDQQAALFGQLCTRPGEAKNTYGTGCFLLQPLGETFRLSEHRLITTLACSADRRLQYALEGSVFVGGAVVQWLRDQLRLFNESAEVEPLAAAVASSGGVYFVPAFTGLGAPHWDPEARGMLIGLERGTGIGQIARAALESIAFQVTEVLEAMEADSPARLRQLRVDGGAAANDLLMQFQADLLGVPVHRPEMLETTALGAAFLAGLALGVWRDVEELRRLPRPERVFAPGAARPEMEKRLRRWREAVERAKGWSRE